MAIADWNIQASDEGASVHLEIDDPIDGTGSLRLSQEDIADDVGVVTIHLRPIAGSPQSEFLRGKIRTLIKPLAFQDDDHTVSFFGIIAMMSQAQVYDTGGAAYFAGRWGGDAPFWAISRVNAGIDGPESFTHLAQGTVLNLPGLDDVCAMELEWLYDPLEFNGVRLTLKAASDDSFSNMVPIYQVVDSSGNSLDSTIGEGLFLCALHDNTGPAVTVLYDKTGNFELVPA